MATVPDVVVRVRVESENLDAAQTSRAEALVMAKRILTRPSAFGELPVTVEDLHALAVFILDGGALPVDDEGADPFAYDARDLTDDTLPAMEGLGTFLTTDEVAEVLRTVPNTVRYWRSHGKGPAWFKSGRRVLYRLEDVRDHLDTLTARDADD